MISAFKQVRLTNSLLTVTGGASGILQVGAEQVVYRSQTGAFATTGTLNATGQYLLGLINSGQSGLGVSSINGLSGALSLTGLGNITVSSSGNTIQISGNTGAYAGFATTGNLALTGANLQTQITNISGTTGNFVTITDQRAINLGSTLVVASTVSGGNLSTNGTLVVGGTATLNGTSVFNNSVSFNNGGAPFTVANTTQITNLNADLLDGLDASSFVLTSNSGSLTGTFVLRSQTGSFGTGTGLLDKGMTGNLVDKGMTGQFYAASNPNQYISTGSADARYYAINNPSGYITGLNTGSFITTNQTGSFVTTGQSGNFIDRGMTGQFYAASNPSGFVTSTQTGFLTNAFYPLNTNPSNYVTSSQTGSFITSGQQQSFVTTVPTGVDFLFVQFSVNFPTTPKIQATIEVTGDTLYGIAVRGRTVSGYNALFSDIVQESGVSVHTFATI